jgi:hypothetical protein
MDIGLYNPMGPDMFGAVKDKKFPFFLDQLDF